jgi:hypothetical protein
LCIRELILENSIAAVSAEDNGKDIWYSGQHTLREDWDQLPEMLASENESESGRDDSP